MSSLLAPDTAAAPRPYAGTLSLPAPGRLPGHRDHLARALRAAGVDASVMVALTEPHALRDRLRRAVEIADDPAGRSVLAPPSPAAAAEQAEHDRYFAVVRDGGGVAFVAGLVNAYAATYADCLAGGVTLLDDDGWRDLFGGLAALVAVSGDGPAPPPRPAPGWRPGYSPETRWLVGHQLFFALIQGAIVGLNGFAGATAAADADAGLALSAAFLRASAAAMRYTTDFAVEDYEATVRPAMAPPAVRDGFSGLQTRDHAHLVRLFAALKPDLAARAGRPAHAEFVESIVSAYAAHEYICARFRGDVLPSLRMAATSRGRSQRPGVEVVRELMRARLALVDPAAGDA